MVTTIPVSEQEAFQHLIVLWQKKKKSGSVALLYFFLISISLQEVIIERAHFSLTVVLLWGAVHSAACRDADNRREDPLSPALLQSGMWMTLPQKDPGIPAGQHGFISRVNLQNVPLPPALPWGLLWLRGSRSKTCVKYTVNELNWNSLDTDKSPAGQREVCKTLQEVQSLSFKSNCVLSARKCLIKS